MKKKLLSLLMATTTIAGLLAGCGSATESSTVNDTSVDSSETAAASDQEVEKIKVFVPTGGKADDMEEVMNAVNAITVPEIGVEVEFKAYEFGQWFQQYSLFLSGTEDVDILANYGGYLNAVSQGAAYDMTDLIQEYGQDIIAREGEYLKSGEIDGHQYAVPIYAGYSWTMGMIYRQDIVDALGLTEEAANATTLEAWEPILAAVKENYPDMTPYVLNNGTTASNFKYGTWDDLGNFYGVLMDPTSDTQVANLFETDEYAHLCSVMHDWYQKGYCDKDIQTQTDSFTVLTKNDAAFCTLGQADFNTAFYQSTTCNKPMGVTLFGDQVARTYNNVCYTIMSNTEHPEAAMKFMNLWMSNEEVGTLISYGIEGKHYVLDENGMGKYPDGVDAGSVTYHLGSNLSNINRILWETENPDYPDLLVQHNTDDKKSKALGFSFDTEKVTNEITQLDNVCSKYQAGLETGTLDPEQFLPEFNAALKDAGIDTVLAEKQAQLDAFLAQ
jgi:putative aldouronate transport system substrate-binding protein